MDEHTCKVGVQAAKLACTPRIHLCPPRLCGQNAAGPSTAISFPISSQLQALILIGTALQQGGASHGR